MNQRRYIARGNDQPADAHTVTRDLPDPAIITSWTIHWIREGGAEDMAVLHTGERVVIGSRADADLLIDDRCVSGCHCALDASKGELMLVDLASTNGVFIGSARIDCAKITAHCTTFTIGKTHISVRSHDCASSPKRGDRIDGLEGESEPMLRLRREISRLAKLRAPVLVVGETGSGKDVVARALHRLSGRTGAYVPINVATIPETLADSELFGHKRGAFTGALQSRIGAFEQANRGTLFLDEVGELAPAIQAKMLRILEDGAVRPVGATDVRQVDVRVISATWASLPERSAAGKFRFDLLQRLSMTVVDVPPLRERRSDIPLLAEYWLRKHCTEFGCRNLTMRALKRLCEHDWPGNVRELGGTVYRACAATDGDVIDVDAIALAMAGPRLRCNRVDSDPQEVLRRAGGNVSEAARMAGLPRTTYRNWLKRGIG